MQAAETNYIRDAVAVWARTVFPAQGGHVRGSCAARRYKSVLVTESGN